MLPRRGTDGKGPRVPAVGRKPEMTEVGKKAPTFTLYDDKGDRVSLKDFLGQKLVLYFYPKDDTPG